MSLNKEPFYKLVKIEELSKVPNGKLIQIIGNIKKIVKPNSIVISDDSGNYSLNNIEISKYKENIVIRVYGRWNGIDIESDTILIWDIPSEKIKYLFL